MEPSTDPRLGHSLDPLKTSIRTYASVVAGSPTVQERPVVAAPSNDPRTEIVASAKVPAVAASGCAEIVAPAKIPTAAALPPSEIDVHASTTRTLVAVGNANLDPLSVAYLNGVLPEDQKTPVIAASPFTKPAAETTVDVQLVHSLDDVMTFLSMLYLKHPNFRSHKHVLEAAKLGLLDAPNETPTEFAFAAGAFKPKITFDRALANSGHPIRAIRMMLLELQALLQYKEIGGYSMAWACILDDAQRQNHPSYPLRGARLTDKQRAAHQQAQAYLFNQLYNALGGEDEAGFFTRFKPDSWYDDAKRIGDEPWPFATKLLEAVLSEYDPRTPGANDKALTTLDNHVTRMPVLERDNYPAFHSWLSTFIVCWDKVTETNLRPESEMIRLVIRRMKHIKFKAQSNNTPSVDFTELLAHWTPPMGAPPATMTDLLQQLKTFAKEMHGILVENDPPATVKNDPPATVNVAVSSASPALIDSALNTQLQAINDKIDRVANSQSSPATSTKICILCNGKHDVSQCRQFHTMKKQMAADSLRGNSSKSTKWRNRTRQYNKDKDTKANTYKNSNYKGKHFNPNFQRNGKFNSDFRPRHRHFNNSEQPHSAAPGARYFKNYAGSYSPPPPPPAASANVTTVHFDDVVHPLPEFTGHVQVSDADDKDEILFCISDTESNDSRPDLLKSSSDESSDEELYKINNTCKEPQSLPVKRAKRSAPISSGVKKATNAFHTLPLRAPTPPLLAKDEGYDGDNDVVDDAAHDKYLSQQPGYPVTISAAGMQRFQQTLDNGNPLCVNAHAPTCLWYNNLTKCLQTLPQKRIDLLLEAGKPAATSPLDLPPVAPTTVFSLSSHQSFPTTALTAGAALSTPLSGSAKALTCAKAFPAPCRIASLCPLLSETGNKIYKSELSATCQHLHVEPPIHTPKISPLVFTYTTTISTEKSASSSSPTPQAELSTIGLIVDSGTSKHILHSQDYALNPRPHHACVAGFAGAYSRSTHLADLAIQVRTSEGILKTLLNHDTALILPDARNNLLSVRCLQKDGHEITLGSRPGLLLFSNKSEFIPFTTCPNTGLWLLPCLPHPTKHNGLYAMQGTEPNIEEIQALKNAHQALGHPSYKRMRQLNITGSDLATRPTKRLRQALTCPTCITGKMRRKNTPPAINTEPQFDKPWAKIFVDLSGKFKTRSITGVSYFVVFVCNYSGAKYTDFLVHKSDFFHAYKRFVTHLHLNPQEIYILHTDLGGEFKDKALTDYLEQSGTEHRMCSRDEHHEIGAAENAVGTLRTTAKCLLIDSNVWKKFWPFAIGHATYLSNLTSRSRANPHLTPYEILFQQKADLSKVPPFGCYAASFRDRKSLKDQSLDLTSQPGIFIGINRHNKNLGYCLTDGNKIWITRNHISFDRNFFPLTQRTQASSPAWATYHNLVHFRAQHSSQPASTPSEDPLAYDAPSPRTNVADPSASTSPNCKLLTCTCDICKQFRNSDNTWNDEASCLKSVGCKCPICRQFYDKNDTWDDVTASRHVSHNAPTATAEDEASSSSDEDTTPPTAPTATRPKRAAATNATLPPSLIKKPRTTKSPSATETRYLTDATYRQERDSHIGKPIQRFFTSHARIFKGKVTEYHYSTDTYSLLYEDDDQEVVTYDELQTLLPDSPRFTQHDVCAAVVYALHTACTDAEHVRKQQYSEPLTYKEALASPDAKFWIEAMQLEMKKLQDLNCWTIIKRADLPPNAAIMKSKWVFKYKTDENGDLTDVGRRARYVGKGFTQIKDINYFETYSAVAHGNTIRYIFSLTALPGFQCWHFDVSVAFIQSKVDPNEPPIYVEPPPGFTQDKQVVFLLNRLLYGMKQSPRGWSLLLNQILTSFGLTRLRTDEAVYILRKSNSSTTPPYPDCTHPEVILILVTYVDDILAFSNSATLVQEFNKHCNQTVKMNLEGICRWYLSVKYDRDPVTGAVSASQELYINKLLQKYGLEQCNPLPVPFPGRGDAVLKLLDAAPKNPSPTLKSEYQSLIGSLLYLQMHTVPEISYALSVLSRYLANPGETHMAYAKKILRYLKGRRSIPIRYCAQTCTQPYLPGHLYGYSDASFADVYPDRHSTIGYVFLCNGAAVSWRSTKSSMIALNTAEAELIAMSAATQEAMYLRKLANELGFLQTSPTILYQDNQAAVALSADVRFKKRSKHIALRFSYVAERQLARDIDVVSVSRTVMLADIMATPRPAANFLPFRDQLLGLETNFTMLADVIQPPSPPSSDSDTSAPDGPTHYIACIECDNYFFASTDAPPICPSCLSADTTHHSD